VYISFSSSSFAPTFSFKFCSFAPVLFGIVFTRLVGKPRHTWALTTGFWRSGI
jgi:hypothetical protein